MQQLHSAAVAVVVSCNEMGHYPERCRAVFDTALARLAGKDLGDRNATAPQMVLKIELEDDPIPMGIAPASAKYVPRAGGIFYQKINVPRACEQPPHQTGAA
jgi:hypothetical protein